MKLLLVLAGVFLASTIGFFCQGPRVSAATASVGVPNPHSTPTPKHTPRPKPTPRVHQNGPSSLVGILNKNKTSSRADKEKIKLDRSRVAFSEYSKNINRKPSESELAAVAPAAELIAKYSEFLRQPQTGLFKLVLDKGCAADDRVIKADDYCAKYSLPGAGNSFSFRTANYRVREFADLTFTSDKFSPTGLYDSVIMANLGDVPIEGVSLDGPGVKFLTEYVPSERIDKISADLSEFKIGETVNGFLYRNELPVSQNTTYAMRSIAYRGDYPLAFRGVTYNALELDKRRDVIVVFRVVGRDDDGSVSILWHELEDKKSPSIKKH